MDRYRTSWSRVCAAVVDGIVFVPIMFLDAALLSPERPSWVIISWAVASYSSYWLYSTFLHAYYGQTIGKKLLGVRVLDVGEQRLPTLARAFVRDIGIVVPNTLSAVYLAYLVFTRAWVPGAEITSLPGEVITWVALGWFALELTTMLTNERRRAFHDYIANTVVVRDA